MPTTTAEVMQVACPSCAAEYPVDERRLPASGLKMRCPKCGARFHVHPDGRVASADGSATKPAAPSPPDADLPAPRRAVPKPPAGAFPKPGGAAFPKPAAGAFPNPGPRAGAFPKPGEADLPAPRGRAAPPIGGADLPAPKRPGAPARRKIAPPVPPSGDLDLDLPAPRGAKPAPPSGDLDLDLPAPAAKKRPLAPPIPGAAKPREPLGDLDLDLPAPRGAQPPAPPAPRGAKPTAPDLDLDLPAPRGAAAASKRTGDLGLDLPAPRAGTAPASADPLADLDLDLPAPRGGAPASADPLGDLDLDLPAPRGAAAPDPLGDLDLDLPAPRGGASADPLGDLGLDLPARRRDGLPPTALEMPAAPRSALEDEGTPFDDLDLPAPVGASRPGPSADLPAPKAADLPALRSDFGADLPAAKSKRRSVVDEADEVFGDLDLPMPKPAASAGFGDLDLPVPKEVSDLPTPRDDAFGDLELPTPRSDPGNLAFDDLNLPTPRDVTDLPQVHDGVDLPQAADRTDLPVVADRADLPVARDGGGDFDDLALPEASGPLGSDFADASFGEPSPPTPEPLRDAAGRAGVGGVAFGELDLGDGGGGDDMEFADIPEEGEAAAAAGVDSLPPPRVVAQKGQPKAKAAAGKKKSRAIVWVAALLTLLLAAGGALGFTPYGVFGINLIDQLLPGAGDPVQVRAAITTAEEQAASDAWLDVRESLVTLGRARRGMGLNAELLSRSLVHENLYRVRFGDDFGATERAARIAARVNERGMEGPEIALGLAASNLAGGNAAGARPLIARARTVAAADDPYPDLVLGEVELAEGNLEEAAQAFLAAHEKGGGARALWGVARARLRAPITDETREAVLEARRAAVDAVLDASPRHGDALAARAALHAEMGEAEPALAMARQAAGLEPLGDAPLRAAPSARASAQTTIGRIEESRGRVTAALQAYEAALAAEDSHVPALLGAGRVLLADRPADALARFDSVLQTEGPERLIVEQGRTAQQEARLGIGRAQLALERISDASQTLEGLFAERPEDAEVVLWLGKASEAQDPPNHEAAEGHFREAIRLSPTTFQAYLALAELFLATDRGDDAGAFLERAEAEVPETAEMRYQLGAFEVRRNNNEAAIRELTRALALEPDMPPALFSLGVAYRRSGRLDDAARTFERLGAVDGGHPGLSLERGLLFEARGEAERAADAYQSALESNPDDVDLLLRLGAAQVAARRIDEADATLDRVRNERPNSSEANHFVGRVAFARGNYAEALTFFRRAVQLDPSRGEFHLFVGRAALEIGQLGEALRSADAAIERDPSLGDAYWVRGVVRLRSGHPSAALEDLQRALVLKPSRYEALAARGDAYDQLSQLDNAIASYEEAVEHVDDDGQYWYRLGRLRLDRGRDEAAGQALQRATLIGDATSPLPGWLADAHRLRGDVLRRGSQRAQSIPHYRRYLELAPASAIDRRAVRELLMDMGEVP